MIAEPECRLAQLSRQAFATAEYHRPWPKPNDRLLLGDRGKVYNVSDMFLAALSNALGESRIRDLLMASPPPEPLRHGARSVKR